MLQKYNYNNNQLKNIIIELDDHRSEDETDPTKGGEETDVRIWGGLNFLPHSPR